MASTIATSGETEYISAIVQRICRESQRQEVADPVERGTSCLEQRISTFLSLCTNQRCFYPVVLLAERIHARALEPTEPAPKRAKTSAVDDVAKSNAPRSPLTQDVVFDNGGPASLRRVQDPSGPSPTQVIRDTETVVPSASPTESSPGLSSDSSYREGEDAIIQTVDGEQENVSMADPRAAAAKELLLKVARTPYPANLTQFPEWERRVFQLLGRPHEPKAAALLGETMQLVTKLKLNNKLGACVDRIIQVLGGFPRSEGGGVSMDASVADLERSVSRAKEDFMAAENVSGVARKAVLAWTQVIDSVIAAMDVYQQRNQAEKRTSASWEQLQLHALDRLCIQKRLEENVERCTKLGSDADAKITWANMQLKQIEHKLREQMATSDADFARVYEAAAAEGDFAQCARLHEDRAKDLSVDGEVSLLQQALAQTNEEVLSSSKVKVRAEDRRAYWASLLELLQVAEQQYDEHVTHATEELNRAEHEYSERTATWVSWMSTALMLALEQYFGHSFQVQVNALEHVDRLLRDKKEHDARLGGYVAFGKSVEIKTYKKIVHDAEEGNAIVIEKLQTLWENQRRHVDGAPTLFPFAELDQKLTGTYEEQWNQIKEPLQQAINATSGNVATLDDTPEEHSANGCVDNVATTSDNVPELTTAEVEVRGEVRGDAVIGLAVIARSPEEISRCTVM